MAITVDYTQTPWLITIPQSDLTFVGGTQYTLTVNKLWELLRDYADGEEGIARPVIYNNIPPTSSTPRIVEINDNYYALQFEDGSYSVEVINGNSNVRDVEVKNSVSVGTNNTTGFIDPTFLEFSTYEGGVWLNTVTGSSGTAYPAGTPASPVNNLTDAKAIAEALGFDTIFLRGTYVFGASDSIDGYIFEGLSATKTTVVLTESASITNCIFRNCTLNGWLDGGNQASFCIIVNLNYIDGSLLDCLLAAGTITLSGTQANFLRCASAVAGGGVGQTPVIDMNGSGTDLVIRDYQGGIELRNDTSGDDNISIDMSSGRVVLDSTISSGTYTIRGIADVEDNSTGTAVIDDYTLNDKVDKIPQLFLN